MILKKHRLGYFLRQFELHLLIKPTQKHNQRKFSGGEKKTMKGFSAKNLRKILEKPKIMAQKD